MADLRAIFSTQIALVLQRMGDRDLNLSDLDPTRRNTRTVTLMAIERMKLDKVTTRTALSNVGTPIIEDLIGTKNGVNLTFTLSQTPQLGSLLIFHQNAGVTRVTGTPASGHYSISGLTVTMGLAPDSTDSLWASYVVA